MRLTRAAMLAILFALIGSPSFAQSANFGVAVGANMAKLVQSNCRADQEPCNLDYQTGFKGGVFADIMPGNPMYAIETGLLFDQAGGKDPQGAKERNKINYLEIPVLAKVVAPLKGKHVFLVAGPTIGIRMSAKDSTGKDIKDYLKSTDVQVVFGGGVEFTNRLSLEARFQQSLFDTFTDAGRAAAGAQNMTHNVFQNRSISVLLDVKLSR